MKKLIVGTTVMVVVLLAATAALADDFKGFYVGGYAGIAMGRSRPTVFTDDTGAYFASSSVSAITAAGNQNLNTNVFNGGGALGYNFKSEEGLVFGLEADFGTMRLNKDVSTTVTYPCCAPSTFTIRQVLYTDYLITARARVGWAHGRAMYYVTGGLAATNVNPYRGVFSDTFGPAYENTSANGWLTGWTIGAGVEVKATRHWTVKGEYLYADFGDVTLVGTDFNILGVPVPGQVFIYNTDVRAHMLRGGVNYYF